MPTKNVLVLDQLAKVGSLDTFLNAPNEAALILKHVGNSFLDKLLPGHWWETVATKPETIGGPQAAFFNGEEYQFRCNCRVWRRSRRSRSCGRGAARYAIASCQARR